MHSAIGLQLVSGSVMSGHFGVGIDLGAQLYGDLLKGPLTYYLSWVNGSGQNAANGNRSCLAGGRLEYTVTGEIFPFQGDPDYSENPNLGFGGTLLYDFGSPAETEDFAVLNCGGFRNLNDQILRTQFTLTF